MKKLNVFYFSGTGNTKFVAAYLANKLKSDFETQIFDVAAKNDFFKLIDEAAIVMLAFPIYGSTPPIPMRQFVFAYEELWRGKKVAIAETQYFFSGDGAASLGRALIKLGADVAYAEHFNMPNNIADSSFFKVRNGKETDRIINRAKKRMDDFADKIIFDKRFRRGFNVISRAVGYYGQRKWFRKSENEKRSKLTVSNDKCVGCGKCVKNCPVENLLLVGGKASAKGKCVFCYRCVNLCPKDAITLFGSKIVTKYHSIDG